MDQDLLAAFEQYRGELQAFLRTRLDSPELADDLLQDLYLKLDSYTVSKKIQAPRAFLYRAANNLLADHFRTQARRDAKHQAAADPADEATDERTPEQIALQRERLRLLQRAVTALPDKCQQVFRMRRFEELEKEVIAARLGISVNMVEKHLRKALSECQSALAARLGEGD
ncbi:MAG: sigma-70 family RNA polymerase sigma factor [Pseudomonadota bacterium]